MPNENYNYQFNKGHYFLSSAALLLCLFIYFFYRTEQTVLNIWVKYIFEKSLYFHKINISQRLPLPDFMVYSLPEGLWVFVVTLFSKSLFFKIKNVTFYLIYFPIIYAISLEFIQLTHLINGIFDIMDVLISLFFWVITLVFKQKDMTEINILEEFQPRIIMLILIYSIVFLSHVCMA